MASTVRVFDPAGHVRVVEVEAAPRPASLDGLRPGILENRKPNARVLMEAMVAELRGRAPLGALAVGSKPVSGPLAADVRAPAGARRLRPRRLERLRLLHDVECPRRDHVREAGHPHGDRGHR